MYYPCSKAKYKLITPYFYICISKYKNTYFKMENIYIYYFVLLSPFLFHPIYFVLFLYRIRMREVLFFIIILFYWIEKASYFFRPLTRRHKSTEVFKENNGIEASYFFRPLTRRHKSTEVFKENNGIGPINWTYDSREKLKLTKEKKNKKKHEHGFQAASRILKIKKRERKIILITYSFN